MTSTVMFIPLIVVCVFRLLDVVYFDFHPFILFCFFFGVVFVFVFVCDEVISLWNWRSVIWLGSTTQLNTAQNIQSMWYMCNLQTREYAICTYTDGVCASLIARELAGVQSMTMTMTRWRCHDDDDDDDDLCSIRILLEFKILMSTAYLGSLLVYSTFTNWVGSFFESDICTCG